MVTPPEVSFIVTRTGGDSAALLIRGMTPPPPELMPISINGGRGEGGEMFLDDELSISERDIGNNHPSYVVLLCSKSTSIPAVPVTSFSN